MRASTLLLALCSVAAFRAPPRLARSLALRASPATPAALTVEGLRGLRLTDSAGQLVQLGTLMGEGDSVVCFLRHFG